MKHAREFSISLSQLDPDDDSQRGVWHDVTLRIHRHHMAHARPIDAWGRKDVEARSYYPITYPRILQWLVTPFYAPFGIPYARRDLTWNIDDPEHPILEMRSCVPQDFWYGFRFASAADGDEARRLVDLTF
jgi:hypothetical protein